MSAPVPHLCRDCFYDFDGAVPTNNCPKCASPRLMAHVELRELAMAHIDCDAFFASIEKRDRPDLFDKPVMIGGGKRGVVSTCCYIARMSGVRSAMPMVTARRKCPDAVIIKPDMKKYVTASIQIKELMGSLTPQVEPLSIDEAFLDLSGTQKVHRAFPAQALAKLARRIEDEIGVTVSIGLSHNKFLAKIASDLDKPRGMALIGKAETVEFLAEKPISIIYGIGKVMTETLRKHGLVNIGQIQAMEERDLILKFGEMGARLFRLSRGMDARKLSTNRSAKSVSAETTFFDDLSQFDDLNVKLLALCERVSARLKKSGHVGHVVTLKLKTTGFSSRTRARHLALPTQLTHAIFEVASDLLHKEIDGTRFRLIGVGLSQIETAGTEDPIDLIEPNIAKKAAAERAIDAVRDKFGQEAVVRGRLYRQNQKRNALPPDNEEN